MATTLASASATSAQLHCRHCGGEIASDSRRVQCVHCSALFPFACLVCSRNLRTPFSVFEDERYLTFPSTDESNGAVVEPKPLCAEHFLRHCPDCGRWFHAHENPGFFRCGKCAAAHEQILLASLTPKEPIATPALAAPALLDVPQTSAPSENTFSVRARQLNANIVALSCAAGALLGLVCWYLLQM